MHAAASFGPMADAGHVLHGVVGSKSLLYGAISLPKNHEPHDFAGAHD